jgi:hypothetical protein
MVSELKTPLDRAEEVPALTTSPSIEQWLDQGKDLLCQDVVASIDEIVHSTNKKLKRGADAGVNPT